MVQKFTTLADCVRLAEFAHFNQFDKAGLSYIEHPRRVLQAVQTQGALPYVQMAAILHDVTEDTAFTCDMLRDLGVPEAAVDIVKLVDRDASKARWDYLWSIRQDMVLDMSPLPNGDLDHEGFDLHYGLFGMLTADDFYYTQINKNPGARQVKLADIGDNIQPWRLSYLPPAKQAALTVKYSKALRLLAKNESRR